MKKIDKAMIVGIVFVVATLVGGSSGSLTIGVVLATILSFMYYRLIKGLPVKDEH